MARLKVVPVLLLVVATIGTASAQQAPPHLGGLEKLADSVFAGYLREYAQPSAAVAVTVGDSVLLLKGYGFESSRPRRAVDPESTLFNIASISKLVTATAVMKLVVAGRLSLDDDVRKRLGPEVIEGDGPPITIRQLLTHTSGLDGAFMRAVVATPAELYSMAEYFRRFPLKRGRPPGLEIRYSNDGVALAGHLIEVASGQRFEDYVSTHVLEPRGMLRSTFEQPPPPTLAQRVATYGSGPVPDALILAPAGAMVSSAADMSRFMRAALEDSAMFAPQWRADESVPGVGLGFFTSDIGGVPGVFHTGARTHFSLLYLVPSYRLGIFVVQAMRQGGPHQTLRTDFARAVIEHVTGGRDSIVHVTRPDWPAATIFAGVYRPSMLATTNIERAARLGMDSPVEALSDGTLVVNPAGGPKLSLARVGPLHFRVNTGPQRGLHFFFERGTDGGVTGFSMSGVTQDPVSFERLPMLVRGAVHAIVLMLFAAVLVAGVLATPILWWRHRRLNETQPAAQRWAWRALVATGVLAILAPTSAVLLVVTHQGEDTAANGLRFALRVGLAFLLLAAISGVTLPGFAALALEKRWWGRVRRGYYVLAAAGVLVAIPLLWHYHLIGFWL